MGRNKTKDIYYRAEPAGFRLVEPLDIMTLIYQRRSGITHIVSEPIPQILDIMGDGPCNASSILQQLMKLYEFDEQDGAEALIAEHLTEMEQLGLVERANA